MFVALRMIALPPDRRSDRDVLLTALRKAAAELTGVRSTWMAPVSRVAVINAGDIVWRMTFDTERDALALALDPVWRAKVAPLLQAAQTTGVGYPVTKNGMGQSGAGIWRALIFRVTPEGFPDKAKALEDGLLLFPKYIAAIRSWALSRVATAEGPKAYTHVWEQEFESLEGLTGAYMANPIHWGLVDAYFDAEYPQYVVDPQLIQVVAEIDHAIMV